MAPEGASLRVTVAFTWRLVAAPSSLAAWQQHLVGLPFAVIVVTARSNRLADLLAVVPRILESLDLAGPGQVIRVGG